MGHLVLLVVLVHKVSLEVQVLEVNQVHQVKKAVMANLGKREKMVSLDLLE